MDSSIGGSIILPDIDYGLIHILAQYGVITLEKIGEYYSYKLEANNAY